MATRREALPTATDRRLVADRLYEQALLALLVADGHLRPSPAQRGQAPATLRRAAARLQALAAAVEAPMAPASPAVA
jgi:hypothetical protein